MLTHDELQAIDQILEGDGLTPIKGQTHAPWYGGAVMDLDVPDDLQQLGVVGIALIPDLRARSKYEHSRWVFVRDPQDASLTRFVPELHLRATKLFGRLEAFHTPAWVEGEVKLFTRQGAGEESPHRPNSYGAPAGTSEYAKAWRARNAEKVKANNRKHYRKTQELIKLAKRSGLLNQPVEQNETSEVVDPVAKALQELRKA